MTGKISGLIQLKVIFNGRFERKIAEGRVQDFPALVKYGEECDDGPDWPFRGVCHQFDILECGGCGDVHFVKSVFWEPLESVSNGHGNECSYDGVLSEAFDWEEHLRDRAVLQETSPRASNGESRIG